MQRTITNDRFLESHTIMAKADTTTRAPRGTKPVTQAFFTALDAIPEAIRPAVFKAALVMIRDEMKMQKEKTKATAVKVKAAAAKEKAKTVATKPVVAKPVAAKKAAVPKTNGAAPAKRRSRKLPDVPASA